MQTNLRPKFEAGVPYEILLVAACALESEAELRHGQGVCGKSLKVKAQLSCIKAGSEPEGETETAPKESVKKAIKKHKAASLPLIQQVSAHSENPYMEKLEQLVKDMASIRAEVSELKQKQQSRVSYKENRHVPPLTAAVNGPIRDFEPIPGGTGTGRQGYFPRRDYSGPQTYGYPVSSYQGVGPVVPQASPYQLYPNQLYPNQNGRVDMPPQAGRTCESSRQHEDAVARRGMSTPQGRTRTEERVPSLMFNGYCFKCSGYGHRAIDCPLNGTYPTL